MAAIDVMLPALKVRIQNADFWEFVERPENAEKRFELINGVIYEMAAPRPLHGLVVMQIIRFLLRYLDQQDRGYLIGESYDFELAEGWIVQPDVAFLSYSRQPKLPRQKFRLAPDLAVEVLSPGNTVEEIQKKIGGYLRYGSRLVWVVDPIEKTVQVYHLTETGKREYTLQAHQTLTGEEVLPDFQVLVGDLFPVLEVEEDEISQ